MTTTTILLHVDALWLCLSPEIINASGQAFLNITNQGSKMAYLVKANGLNEVASVALGYTLGSGIILLSRYFTRVYISFTYTRSWQHVLKTKRETHSESENELTFKQVSVSKVP